MNPVARRLRRLEAQARAPSRSFVVFSGGASDEEVWEMLASDHGIEVGPSDELIHFVTLYLDKDGNPAPDPPPPRYMPTAASLSSSRAPRP